MEHTRDQQAVNPLGEQPIDERMLLRGVAVRLGNDHEGILIESSGTRARDHLTSERRGGDVVPNETDQAGSLATQPAC
ncbi:hypothetical protein MSA03_24600 [Microbacterium saccharophilum]|nr:hypothetical protein MSA03_24600 [Microbacterium saccharophilum]